MGGGVSSLTYTVLDIAQAHWPRHSPQDCTVSLCICSMGIIILYRAVVKKMHPDRAHEAFCTFTQHCMEVLCTSVMIIIH